MSGETIPSLGGAVGNWIQANCAQPDGERRGEPFLLTDEQWNFLLNFYALDSQGRFLHRRGGMLVRPQKWGKGPLSAAIICAEAAGPTRFSHWEGEEPVGRTHPSAWIQVAAVSQDQTANVWRALLPMIELGTIAAEIPDTGLTRINLTSGGLIEYVTASHRSRVGQPITFAVCDELGFWIPANHGHELADAISRNLVGMKGRFLGLTNAWALNEESVGERMAAENGVYVDNVEPGRYSIRNKAERRKALKIVYGDSASGCKAQGNATGRGVEGWIDLSLIDEMVEALIARDVPQARRFFFNEKLAGAEAAFDIKRFRQRANTDYRPSPGAEIVITVDGALNRDALAAIGTEIETGFQWPIAIETRPADATEDYRHNQDAVDAAVTDAYERRFNVLSIRVDPQYVESLLAKWQARWGDAKVLPFYTNTQTAKIAHAVRRYSEAIASGELSHDGDETFTDHVKNAVRRPVHVRDDDDRPLHTIRKDHPNSPRKIDAAMAAVMGWEARYELIAQHREPQPSSEIEEVPLRELPGQPTLRRGDMTFTGERYLDRDNPDHARMLGPRRGR